MKDLKEIVNFIWNYLRKHIKKIIIYIITVILYEMLEVVNTVILGNAIDNMLLSKSETGIMRCAMTFLVVNCVSFFIGYFAKVNGQNTMELAINECQIQIAQRIEKTSLKHINSTGASALMKRLNTDITMIVIFGLNVSARIPVNVITFMVAIAIIFSMDIVCGIITLLEIPLIIILYMKFCPVLFERNQASAEAAEKRHKSLYELISDMSHFKKNEINGLMVQRFAIKSKKAIKAIKKTVQIEYYYNIINNNMDTFLKVFLFFYGGLSVIKDNMTVGEFTVIYSSFSLVTSACTYFLNLGKEIQKNKAYYERLKSITDVAEETNGAVLLSHIDKVELSHIKFGYNETDTVIHDFSYTFNKGNIYVVAGSNGSGKSTMTSLLLGMYIDECEGQITYNGHSIKELDMRTLRREKIGVCEQEPYLIEDTIRYNMIYSNDTVDDENLMKLAYHVSFDDFLKNSENGLDTQVGKGGNALSGGQKQKTALVKAFYKNPDVLVLDEPTSAMDAEGQERLIKYLTSIKKDKIIIVITHDERMMMAADEVVRM